MSMEPAHRRTPLVPGLSESRQVVTDTRQLRPIEDRPLVNTGPVGSIAKALAGVMTKVGTIPKNGYNKFHNYHYATMGDILNALTPLMGEQGIALLQNEISINPIENNRVAVTYEFTIAHESNETWHFRQTGMALARDSKGNWDDKALNKCHTAARKYALLSLFQVPSGDFEDADEDKNATQRTEQRPVPGPKQAEASQESRAHKITLPQGTTADQWAAAYIRNIGKAISKKEIEQWENLNDDFLDRINDRYPEIYEMLRSAVQRRLSDIGGQPAGMPDPKADPQEAMNWIAGQLANIKTYQAAESFWNEIVAPRETEFEVVDWGMLMKEWYRTEQRLAPPQENTEQE